MAIAFVFPGQGSQAVGMGAELAKAYASARAVFDEVDAALGQKLSEIMFNGPLDTLTLTENAQPALMAVSLAVMRVLEVDKGFRLAGKVKYVAGHSLGEYSALAAAGAISVADAARLLKTRGQAMQAAVPVGQGAMAALLGVGKEAAEKLAAEAAQGEVCQLANDNEPTQAVISGAKTAIDRAAPLAKAHGVRRFLPLNVSAPFHCALMQPAADVMAEALAKVEVKSPVGAADRQRAGRADLRSGRDQAAPRRAGHRAPCAGASAWRAWRPTASPTSTRSARARCWPGSPSASRRRSMQPRSARRRTSTPRCRRSCHRGPACSS